MRHSVQRHVLREELLGDVPGGPRVGQRHSGFTAQRKEVGCVIFCVDSMWYASLCPYSAAHTQCNKPLGESTKGMPQEREHNFIKQELDELDCQTARVANAFLFFVFDLSLRK